MKTMTNAMKEQAKNALQALQQGEQQVGLYNGSTYSLDALPAIDFIFEHGQVVASNDVYDADGYHDHVAYKVLFADTEVTLFAKYAKMPHAIDKSKQELIKILESVIS